MILIVSLPNPILLDEIFTCPLIINKNKNKNKNKKKILKNP